MWQPVAVLLLAAPFSLPAAQGFLPAVVEPVGPDDHAQEAADTTPPLPPLESATTELVDADFSRETQLAQLTD